MFTSRAEYRLMHARGQRGSAAHRKTGRRLGLVDDARWDAFTVKRERIEGERARLETLRVGPSSRCAEALAGVLGAPLTRDCSVFDLLKRPETSYQALVEVDGLGPGIDDEAVAQQLEVQARYDGYIQRQRDEIERARQHEDAPLPEDLDYAAVRGLSAEVREKLEGYRPASVGQAARIAGVTPAAVSLLLVHLKKRALSARIAPASSGEGEARRIRVSDGRRVIDAPLPRRVKDPGRTRGRAATDSGNGARAARRTRGVSAGDSGAGTRTARRSGVAARDGRRSGVVSRPRGARRPSAAARTERSAVPGIEAQAAAARVFRRGAPAVRTLRRKPGLRRMPRRKPHTTAGRRGNRIPSRLRARPIERPDHRGAAPGARGICRTARAMEPGLQPHRGSRPLRDDRPHVLDSLTALDFLTGTRLLDAGTGGGAARARPRHRAPGGALHPARPRAQEDPVLRPCRDDPRARQRGDRLGTARRAPAAAPLLPP